MNDRESEDSALKRFRNLTKVSKVVYEVRSAGNVGPRASAESVVSVSLKQPVHAHAQLVRRRGRRFRDCQKHLGGSASAPSRLAAAVFLFAVFLPAVPTLLKL